MDYGFWQGAERATGNAAAAGMQLLNYQQNKEHQQRLEADAAAGRLLQERQIKTAEDTAKINQRILGAQAAEIEKNAELIPFDETLSKMGITPTAKQVISERLFPFIETGGASGKPVIQRQHFEKNLAEFIKDPEFGIQYGKATAQDRQTEIDALAAQLADPQKKLKPEDQKAIEDRIGILVDQRTKADNKVKRYQEQIAAKNKEASIEIQLPDGSWVLHNKITGKNTPLGGTPKSIVEKQVGTAAKEYTLYKGDGKQTIERRAKESEIDGLLAQGWTRERPLFAPAAESSVTLYKGTGRNITERKVKAGEVEGLLAQGWTQDRPVFAPEKPDKQEKPEKAPSSVDKTRLLTAVQKATKEADGTPKDPDPNERAIIEDMADKLGFRFMRFEKDGLPDWKLIQKQPGAQTGESSRKVSQPAPNATPKTVTIEGKQYKDGDRITKDGKEFIVRVK